MSARTLCMSHNFQCVPNKGSYSFSRVSAPEDPKRKPPPGTVRGETAPILFQEHKSCSNYCGWKPLRPLNPPKHDLTVGTRCIALYMDEDDDVAGYFPAIVAEGPSEENDSRFLIFFDVGYMNYLYFPDLREVVGQRILRLA